MRKHLNCPNCGAPITETKCPYCGTVFYDFTDISFSKPTYLKIRTYEDKLLVVKGQLAEFTTNFEPDSMGVLEMKFYLMPNDKGIMLMQSDIRKGK